jgi:2-polyprenyl-6-methoxyphenol hydroxylase-like FAD-dependent oxidoreductase
VTLYTGLEEVESLGRAVEAGQRGGRSTLETYELERLGPAKQVAKSSRQWSHSYLGRRGMPVTG